MMNCLRSLTLGRRSRSRRNSQVSDGGSDRRIRESDHT